MRRKRKEEETFYSPKVKNGFTELMSLDSSEVITSVVQIKKHTFLITQGHCCDVQSIGYVYLFSKASKC